MKTLVHLCIPSQRSFLFVRTFGFTSLPVFGISGGGDLIKSESPHRVRPLHSPSTSTGPPAPLSCPNERTPELNERLFAAILANGTGSYIFFVYPYFKRLPTTDVSLSSELGGLPVVLDQEDCGISGRTKLSCTLHWSYVERGLQQGTGANGAEASCDKTPDERHYLT
ncbi:uncharacterized protein LOC133306335 [Gastrolobium bilobum]|uniref:uncharacterized protein LOC133306335 n=1 Tax=Gastrolobium bilobum TaxID=150636 RepID=UPI002AB1469C|nr:uncharacterized protein LOC133306335 [Gastrolobium bilobum]